jgi:hypothetical protein
MTGNHLDRVEKAPLTFLIGVQAFRDPLRGELPHVQILMNDGPNTPTQDAHLLSYRFIPNLAVFQDKIVNLINNFRDGHCFGSSRRGALEVQNSPSLNRAIQFLIWHKMVHVRLMFCQNGVNFLRRLAL